MSRRHSAGHGHHKRDDESRYKRESVQQPGLTQRLLGHNDAKERITSTLKALGIYKGDGAQRSSSGQQASGRVDLPVWDPIPETSSEKVDRNPTRWSSREDHNRAHVVGVEHLREHSSDYSTSHGVDLHRGLEQSTIHGRPNYESNNQFENSINTDFSLPYNENSASNAPYSQEQQPWSGSSYTQGEANPSCSTESTLDPSGGSTIGTNNVWNTSQSFNHPSSYTHSSNPNPVSAAFSQPWQHDEPNPPTFNRPFHSEVPTSTDSIKGGNFGMINSTPPHQPQSRGLFDIAKKSKYVNPSRPNLKPLVEVTISNPAAFASQKGNIDQTRDRAYLSGAGKGTKNKGHTKGGMKRSNETASAAGRNSKRVKLLPEQEKQPIIKRVQGPLIVPGEIELQHYENDPERFPLICKVMKGSAGHQMETLQVIGIKDDLRKKELIPWKCYICRKSTSSWQNYVSHCTSKFHRGVVHKLGTNAKAREIMREQLLALPLAEECANAVPSSPTEAHAEETKGGVIHPCGACGRFYSKADGLRRHLESEQHRQRVLFLQERFGEGWEQFQWYNQASQPEDVNPEEPVGVAFVVPISGFFCKLCSQFYNSEVRAKDVHCRQSSHIKKVKDWDRTSKGSMISLSLDVNEVAAAVKKNDGASSPPRSTSRTRSTSRRRSPSSSRRDSSREKQGKGSSERSTRSQSKSRDTFKRRFDPTIKIPGLDLQGEKKLVGDLSDVSDDEDPSSNAKVTGPIDRQSKPNGSKTSKGKPLKEYSSLEEGELSASEVRQLEKYQETEKIVKEWEKREKQRRWQQDQEYQSNRREEERIREKRDRERKEKQRKEREEREREERERKKREKIEAERREKEKRERERLEKEKQERERKEKIEKERREREEKERKERERKEKERKEKERVEKEKREKERIEKENREKERIEKELREKERIEKELREKEEKERKEKERREQQEREKERLEQERQIQEERKRLQEAKEQLERTRMLQEQRETEFKDNQMRERTMLEKRIWEQQMRERELMEQQLRQQQSLEQQEFEKAMRQQQSGDRITNRQRREQERKEQELHNQHIRERELREAELRKHQEAEYQRLQEEQLKEQELRHREMLEGIRRETDTREEEQRRSNELEQRRLNEQVMDVREQELRRERLLQVNLKEQEARDRTIREEGYQEWQRREKNMRFDGLPEREIEMRREMFEREVEATVVKDAEVRAQQLGEVLHNSQREGDLREKVIQQQQIRERREALIQELREKARWELERKEMDLRRERFSEMEIEEILTQERQLYDDKILQELRIRGLAEGPSWEGSMDGVDPRAVDAQNIARERSRERTLDEQERNLRREQDWKEEEDKHRARESDRREDSCRSRDDNEEFEKCRSEQAELDRHREEEFEMRRREEEDMIQRQQAESSTRASEGRDIVIHEMGGLRNVQIVGKERLPPGDLREELRERERDDRSSSEKRGLRDNTKDRGRVGRSRRPERSGNNRGKRGRGWRGRPRQSR